MDLQARGAADQDDEEEEVEGVKSEKEIRERLGVIREKIKNGADNQGIWTAKEILEWVLE